MTDPHWPGGFRWREHDGPDRCWLEAIAQVLTQRGLAPITLVAVLVNTALMVVVLYLVLAA